MDAILVGGGLPEQAGEEVGFKELSKFHGSGIGAFRMAVDVEQDQGVGCILCAGEIERVQVLEVPLPFLQCDGIQIVFGLSMPVLQGVGVERQQFFLCVAVPNPAFPLQAVHSLADEAIQDGLDVVGGAS